MQTPEDIQNNDNHVEALVNTGEVESVPVSQGQAREVGPDAELFAMTQEVGDAMNQIDQDPLVQAERFGVMIPQRIAEEYQSRRDEIIARGKKLLSVLAFGTFVATTPSVASERPVTEQNIPDEIVQIARHGESAVEVEESPLEISESSIPDDDGLNGLNEEILPDWERMEDEGDIARGEEITRMNMEQLEKQAEIFQTRERIDQGFANEEEVLTFFGELADRGYVEHGLLYAITEGGSIEILLYTPGDATTLENEIEDFDVEPYRARGLKVLKNLHTHPKKAIEGLFAEEGKTAPELSAPMPFSVPDLNIAMWTAYSDRYTEAEQWQQSPSGTYSYENIVVDPTGVWTYEVNPSHPYVQEVMQARINRALSSDAAKRFLASHPDMSEEQFTNMMIAITSADPIVRGREDLYIMENKFNTKDLIAVVNAISGGGMMNEGGTEYDLTGRQFDVMQGTSQDIQKFIDYFRDRGVNVTYTPKGGQTMRPDFSHIDGGKNGQ